MTYRKTGEYEKYGDKEYFIPACLPPEPPIQMDAEAIELYGKLI